MNHRISAWIWLLWAVWLMMGTGCRKNHEERAAEKMRTLVVDIAQYVRQYNDSFIIIPQNGLELCFEDLDPSRPWAQPYFNAISGVGVEELYFNGAGHTDPRRQEMAEKIGQEKPVLVSELVNDAALIDSARRTCRRKDFLCFVRDPFNYDYSRIPPLQDTNERPVHRLEEAANYLYLINYDSFTSVDELVQRLAATTYDLLLIEPFFHDTLLSPAQVHALQRKPNGARRLVIAYVNIGAAEQWRYYWQADWKVGRPSWLKKPYRGYPDEIWVEFWHPEWQAILWGNDSAYIKRVVDAGFDGAYLDNVEAYYFLYHD